MKDKLLHNIKVHGPVKRSKLLVMMQLHYPELRDRKMRLSIAELIKDGEPISSSEKGYSIIRNIRELTESMDYLNIKAKSISIRKNKLLSNYNRKYQNGIPEHQFKLEI